MTAEYEVAVVGAGAAGLSAGEALRQAGIDYVVLEASNRLGGRSWTDHGTFPGIPFDRGCHWLHSASINPLRAFADRQGLAYDTGFSFDDRAHFMGAERVSQETEREIEAALEDAFEIIADNLGEDRHGEGSDLATSDLVEDSSPWYALFEDKFSLMTSGTPSTVSALDFARSRDTYQDYPVEDGLGHLILEHAQHVEVRPNTAVNSIDWSGKRLALGTNQGTLRAQAVIVTASTSVLADRAIRFTPELPEATGSALEACRLGCYEKVGLLLDAPLVGLPHCITTIDPNGERSPLSFVINPFGRAMVVAEVGGAYAQSLIEEGTAAVLDHAVESLAGALGSGIKAKIRQSLVTDWRHDPWIRGAYSHARPGHAHKRSALSAPIGERIFLAGEATTEFYFASCHGAHMSGLTAAEKAIAVVRA